MTFFYFLNCIALSVIPHVIVYKTTVLAEYDTIYKTAISAAAYVATQTVKLLIEATFFPASDLPPSAVDYAGELLSSATLMADLVGLHFAITQTPGRGTVRWLTAGLGWSAAHLACTKSFALWQARGLEFDWRFLYLAVQANAELLTFITLAALLWMRTRSPRMPTVTFLLILACFKQFAIKVIIHSFFGGAVGLALAAEMVWALLFSLMTMRVYVLQSQQAAVSAGLAGSVADGYDFTGRS